MGNENTPGGPTSFNYTIKWKVPNDWATGGYDAFATLIADSTEFSGATHFTVVDLNEDLCITHTKIIAFYTPIEGDFKTKKLVTINANGTIRDYNEKFVEEVKVEGWGKTRFGDYLGYTDGIFLLSPFPKDARHNPLVIGSAGVDENIIPFDTQWTVPGLQQGFDEIVYTATDIGNYKGFIFNIYTGEGEEARKNMHRITRGNWQICPA